MRGRVAGGGVGTKGSGLSTQYEWLVNVQPDWLNRQESRVKGYRMPIHKRKKRNKVDWYYKFDLPGATRNSRRIIRGFGYATRQEAVAAEANRRLDEHQKSEMAK